MFSSYTELFVESRQFLPTPPALGASIWDNPVWVLVRSSASQSYSPWAIVWHCLHDPTFSHFSRTLTCDRQTDRQTDRQRDRQTNRQTHDYGTHHGSMALCSNDKTSPQFDKTQNITTTHSFTQSVRTNYKWFHEHKLVSSFHCTNQQQELRYFHRTMTLPSQWARRLQTST